MEDYTCVYNVEEEVQLEQFLCEFIPRGDKIFVDANWLQEKLKHMYLMEIKEKKLKKEKEEMNKNLSILKSRIDTLNTTVQIMKVKKPEVRVNRYLNVKLDVRG